MSNVIYPSRFHNSHNPSAPWVAGYAVAVRGEIYLSIAKIWHSERETSPGCVLVDFVSQSTVEFLGKDPEELRRVWNVRFPDDPFEGELLPPCDFSDLPPRPQAPHRKTVMRDFVNMTETLIYEGAA